MRDKFGYRDLLRRVFEDRYRKNASYSLRAFARDLGLSPSRVSEILNNKQGLSLERAKDVAKKLKLNRSDSKHFLDLVGVESAKSDGERKRFQNRIDRNLREQASIVDLDRFQIISDWYHFAIL